MNRTNVSAVALTMTAGLACSAIAQVNQFGNSVLPSGPAQTGVFVAPVNDEPIWVMPDEVLINGRSVPFQAWMPGSTPSVGTDIQPRIAYDNFTNLPAAPAPSGLFTVASSLGLQAVLDDINFAGNQGGRIYAIRYGFITSANIPSNAANPAGGTGFAIFFTWYNGFNAAATGATPVNSNDVGAIGITYTTTPTGGWATGTSYQTGVLWSDFLPLEINGASGSGAVEFNVASRTPTGAYTFATPFPHVGPAFNSNPVAIGSSQSGVWFNNNNATTGQFFSSGSFIAQGGTPPAPLTTNIRLQLQMADAPTGSFGACCLPNLTPQSCVVLRPTQCAANGGTYRGDGTNCALTIATACTLNSNTLYSTPGGIIWSNGPLSTSNVTSLGTFAPPGSQWNEGVQDGTCGDVVAGLGIWVRAGQSLATETFRTFDNFTVPAGETWNVNSVSIFLSSEASAPGIPPTDGIIADIYSGTPGTANFQLVASSGPVAVDTSNATFTNLWFAFNQRLFGAQVPATATERVWEVRVPVTAANLPAGQYWVGWVYNGDGVNQPAYTSLSNPMANPTANPGTGVLSFPTSDALVFAPPAVGSTAAGIFYNFYNGDSGGTCQPYPIDYAFLVRGQRNAAGASTCYANCDGSTNVPVLNAIDFSCFLTRYRNGESYANCDGSTSVPALNAIDFGCFLSRYRNPEAGTNCTN